MGGMDRRVWPRERWGVDLGIHGLDFLKALRASNLHTCEPSLVIVGSRRSCCLVNKLRYLYVETMYSKYTSTREPFSHCYHFSHECPNQLNSISHK